MPKINVGRMLNVVSKAWGGQSGYCFFPHIDRKRQVETGNRRDGYHEGPERAKGDKRGPSFRWPNDRVEIAAYVEEHIRRGHDVYWCPSLFEGPQRLSYLAMDEHALWADLDEVDPRDIEQYPPTVAWQTSPGRFQALWLASDGDFLGASWPGNENQRLSYLLGADLSGWDTTQLLRLPGTPNNKPDYVEANGGQAPLGKLLWSSGQAYEITDFRDLPEVQGSVSSDLTEALEHEVEGVDRLKALSRLKIKLNHTARDLLAAKEVSGDRSQQMWYLMRCLADAGGSMAEIVAIMRPLVWNKFAGRADEMKRLIAEASKAIASRSDEVTEQLEEESDWQRPGRLGTLLRNIKRPVWLVEGVLTEGACGFIAGEPKTWKSWVGYDLALSVSTGADFLGYFPVRNPGPVLYIQEEDPLPVLKTRGAKIWAGKTIDRLVLESDGGIYWLPAEHEGDFDPDIDAMVQAGVTLSEELWQLRLDEVLEKGGVYNGSTQPYRLMLVDTLMMTAGEVDENRSQEMTTKIFRPLKVLARKHNVGLIVVHHLGKSDKSRVAQRMLGSVANHAWAEDSLYLLHSGIKKGTLRMEFESKVAPGMVYKLSNMNIEGWDPHVGPWSTNDESNMNGATREQSSRRTQESSGKRSGRAGKQSIAGAALTKLGGVQSTKTIAAETGLTYQQAYRQLTRDKTVEKHGTGWGLSDAE